MCLAGRRTRSAGAPGKRARSSSRWLATPTGQLLVWHTRAMMQPVAIMATVPKPYSSRAQRGRQHDVAPAAHAAVRAQHHPLAQLVLRQALHAHAPCLLASP